jgi:flagellar basal-body rod protein FlgB
VSASAQPPRPPPYCPSLSRHAPSRGTPLASRRPESRDSPEKPKVKDNDGQLCGFDRPPCIANAATPNFKARDFDFDSELARATGDAGLTRTNARHLGDTFAEGNLGYRVPLNSSLDGNTVELAVEQMEFAENTLRYQTSLQFLNRRISGLMSAIKGE